MAIGAVLLNLVLIVVLFFACLITLIGLPGNWLILFLAVGYGFLQDFATMSLQLLLLLFGLLLFGELVEFAAGALGAKKQKASWAAMIAATVGGVLGALAGTALLPVIGSLVGAFAGAFAASYGAEYFVTGNRQQSGKVARSVFFAQVAAMVVKTAVAIAMVVTIIGHMVWG